MLCVLETRLNSDVTDAEVSVENYNISRRDRQSDRRRGGVALYFKTELSTLIFPWLQYWFLLCRISYPYQLLTVLGAYRSPTSPEADDEQIIHAARLVANQTRNCLILGDFNAPHLNWQTGSCSLSNGFPMTLFEIAKDEFLFQAIRSPTRFREGNNPSILNLAFT